MQSKRDVTVCIEEGGCPVILSVTLPSDASYYDLLAEIDMNPETVVVCKDGRPVPNDDILDEGDVKIIQVISKG
jgi:sulfur carrier protein